MSSANADLDLYLDLIVEFPLRPIRSEEELDKAIAMIDRLSDRDSLAIEEEDYLGVLSTLVETYETEHEPKPVVSAADLLRFLIESQGVPQSKVAADTGVAESTISEILCGKREISRKVMLVFAPYFRVDPAIFI